MKCEYQFCDRQWDNISLTAKDLVKKLLVEDPEIRITAAQALDHEWFNENNLDGQGIIAAQFSEFNK